MSDPRLESLLDRLAVQDAVNALFLATDAKDWPRVEAAFTDEVHFDMTSLAGGEPATMSGKAIAAAWAEGLDAVNAVHHQTGNFVVRVEGDGATVFCYGTATHHRPDTDKPITSFVGSYDFHLVRRGDDWRIDSFRFNKKYVA